MTTGGSRDVNLHEQARQAALNYAACTMHFIRCETADWSFTDFTTSPLKPQALAAPDHAGRPPIDIDRRAQQRFERVVEVQERSPAFGQIIKLGEEAGVPNWDPDETGPATIVRCDPVDGTSALAHSADGFASVVTLEWRSGAGQPWKHYGGAIVRSDGLAISWSRSKVMAHQVVIDVNQRLTPQERPQVNELDIVPPLTSRDISDEHRRKLARSGAAVAAQSPERRVALLSTYPRLVTESDYFDFKAGTPVIWPLSMGMLGFVVELRRTTIHDSIFLFPFMELNGKVVDHDLRPIDVKRVIEANAGPEAMQKVFPPYFAYTDDEALDFIKACIAG
jgi:hypothetical protein